MRKQFIISLINTNRKLYINSFACRYLSNNNLKHRERNVDKSKVKKLKHRKNKKSNLNHIKVKEYKEISQKKLPNSLFSAYQGNPSASVADELKNQGVGFRNVHNILQQLEAAPRKSNKLSSAYARLFTSYYKSPNYNIDLLYDIFTSFLNRGNPRRAHITAMIGAFSQRGQNYINNAMELWQLMQEKNIKPDRVTYNVLLKLVGNIAGDVNSMMLLFDEMKNMHQIKPDATTYSTIIDALGRNDNIDKVLNIFEEFKSSNIEGSHYIVYCATMTALSHHGLVEKNEELFNEMIDKKWQVDEIIFRALAMSYARIGDSQSTELVIKRMQKAGLKPSRPFFVALIGAYARQGDVQGSIDSYQKMKLDHGLKPDDATAHALVDAAGFAGNLTMQSNVFERLCEEKLITPIKNGVLDVRKYTIHGVKVPLNYYFNKYEREYRMGTENIPAKGLHIIIGLGKPNLRDFATQSWPRTTVTRQIALQWLNNFKPRLKFKETKDGLVVIPRHSILEAFRARKALVNLEEEAEILSAQAVRRHQRD